MAEAKFRLRVCYRKVGPLRFLSHLETVRACERAARRAGLPYAVTKGFNPHMKIAFGPALPVGTAGEREYYDLWMNEYVPVAEVVARLSGAAREEIAAIAAVYVNEKEPSLGAALTIAAYQVEVEGGKKLEESLTGSLASVLGTGVLAVEHKGKSKVFELATALPKEPEVRSVEGRTIVDVTIRIGEHGSLRPDALVNAALAHSATDGRVVSVTRTDLLIQDGEDVRRPL